MAGKGGTYLGKTENLVRITQAQRNGFKLSF